MPIKTAIILAGGLGTRLRPLTYKIPKPLIPLQGEKTLTEFNLDILKKAGVTDIILSVSYMADKIKEYFGDGSKFGFNIKYAVEETPMGTAGPLMLIKRLKETFIMINGDNVYDIDLNAMRKFHKANKATATIALTQVDDPSHYGVARMERNKIAEFVEKPKKEDAPSNLISSGYYILEPEVFDFLPKKDFVMMERDIWPVLAKAGKLFGYKTSGYWTDVGTLEKYGKVKEDIQKGVLKI